MYCRMHSKFFEGVETISSEQTFRKYEFIKDERLGISLPKLYSEWSELTEEERHDMILTWEATRGHIPDRIKELESLIDEKQEEIFREEDWERICSLFAEINDYAGRINDLNIWSRVQQDFDTADLADEHLNREK